MLMRVENLCIKYNKGKVVSLNNSYHYTLRESVCGFFDVQFIRDKLPEILLNLG